MRISTPRTGTIAAIGVLVSMFATATIGLSYVTLTLLSVMPTQPTTESRSDEISTLRHVDTLPFDYALSRDPELEAFLDEFVD